MRLLFDSWPLGSMFCYLGPLVQAMSVYVSTLSMVVIAIDRRQMLLNSMHSRLSSKMSRKWTLGLIWILSAIFSTPHFIFNRVVNKQTLTCLKRCEARYPKPSAAYSQAITLFTLLSQYVVPLTIISKWAGNLYLMNIDLALATSLSLQSFVTRKLASTFGKGWELAP